MQRKRRSRQGGQAVVEFGIIAILFTLLMFAIVDFGLLLNTWLSVSAGTRQLARSASILADYQELTNEAMQLSFPAVSTTSDFPTYCCTATSAIGIQVQYYHDCFPGPGCNPVPSSSITQEYLPPGAPPCGGPCYPEPGDIVQVTITANAAQVLTPLVRPFFGCTDGTQGHCYVPLMSTVTMRVEGLGVDNPPAP